MSNSFDPDQARRSVRPDLGPRCSQALSADGTSRLRTNPCPGEQIKMANSLLFSSQFSCVFVRVCLFVPCGHELGKGWPLGSRLLCLNVSLSLSHRYPGSGVVLDCIDSWSLLPYFQILYTMRLRGKQSRSWSDGFPRSNLIWIYTVFLRRYIRVQQAKS